jgi:hypothetical protein
MSNRKVFYCAIIILISFIISPLSVGYAIPSAEIGLLGNGQQNLRTEEIYYDVNIFMISKLYESIEINGFHETHNGKGHDDKITLRDANKFFTIGILIIWDDSDTKEFVFNGGWINTKLEIFDYDGWMSGQNTLFRLKMLGHSEKIIKTIYRGEHILSP